jgi:MoxR-like ATPase
VASLANEVTGALRRFRNVILEGAPGTGKTYVVQELAARWLVLTGRQLEGHGAAEFAITMHPSTAYEDFVEGLRYDEQTGSFRLRNGFMARAVVIAQQHPDRDFLLLLDEINRSNIPKVLGDLLLTLEPSKRCSWDAGAGAWVGGAEVTLPYSGRIFRVPDNIYVLGTMNTTDRSIAPIDAALRRRFAFVRVAPLEGADLDQALRAVRGGQIGDLAADSIGMLTDLNREVLRPVLGPDGELGHSYLFDISQPLVSDAELATALHWAQTDVVKAFWTEVRSGNAGNRNQFDLAETGASSHKGSLELFYPLRTSATTVEAGPDPDRQRADAFVIRYGGQRFEENIVRYNPPTPGWRLYMQGQTQSGVTMSSVAGQIEPIPGHGEARHFEHRLLIWFEREDGDLILERVERTDERIETLKQLSTWHERSQAGANGRDFGLIDLPTLQAGFSAEPRLTWRYAILPQLVELAMTNGVEDLFDPTRRTAWQGAHGVPANNDVLVQLDEFLAGMSIWLRVVGHDLGRLLVILDTAPADVAAHGDVAAPQDGAEAAGPLQDELQPESDDDNSDA